jgi:hypothetical protein
MKSLSEAFDPAEANSYDAEIITFEQMLERCGIVQ